MSTTRDELARYLHELLGVDRFRDYGPNGLQVEGRAQIDCLVTGVTASLALVQAARDEGAHAILVHHGLFWRGQDGRITGWLHRRLRALLLAELNLFAYHLPLDAHPVHGNNAQWARLLGIEVQACFGEQQLGAIGTAPAALDIGILVQRLRETLGREPLLVPGDGRPLRRIAWCTGGAQGYFEAAIDAGADAFLTGEISEPQAHLARETGVAFLACGHHATERYGVQALGEHLAGQFGLVHRFIDIPNPA